MCLENEIQLELNSRGADFVHFVDISNLSAEQNKNYPNAILIGIKLSPDYLRRITDTPDFVEQMIRNNEIGIDEFHFKEIKADRLADYLALFLSSKGFSSYSQSEDNIYQTGFYDLNVKKTPLPHKTVALLAGLGWIGKHNLLINSELGSAFCMCTVLTDFPLNTVLKSPSVSKCGNCNICKEVCKPGAISGMSWDITKSRDELVDVFKCNTCLRCMVLCPWTQSYINKN